MRSHPTNSTKFLGIIINEHLTWNDHINYVANKISKTTGILAKTRHFLNTNTLITSYNTLVYPYLYYGNIMWANNYPSRLKKITKIKKKSIRIITFNLYISKSAPLFQQLKLLNLNQINDLSVSLFMFDYINGNLPAASFNDYFTTNTKIHHHDTRKSNSIHKKYFRTNYGKFSIKTKGTDLLYLNLGTNHYFFGGGGWTFRQRKHFFLVLLSLQTIFFAHASFWKQFFLSI